MIWVSAGYGTDGSSTPTTVAMPGPRRIALPSTVESRWSTVLQNRYVRTQTFAALGPSSPALMRRPSAGRSPMTWKNDPLTTPAVTMRGCGPKPISVNWTVEKSPNSEIVFVRDSRSLISGMENVKLSVPTPGAVWRI